MSKFTTVGTVYKAIVRVLHDEDKRSFIEGRSEKELRNFLLYANECMFKAENTAMPPDMLTLFIETTNELIGLVNLQLELMKRLPNEFDIREKAMAKYSPKFKVTTGNRVNDSVCRLTFEYLKTNHPEIAKNALDFACAALRAHNESPYTPIQTRGLGGAPHHTSNELKEICDVASKIRSHHLTE